MRMIRIGPVEMDLRIPQASEIVIGVRLTRAGQVLNLTALTVYFTVKQTRSTSAAVVLSLSNGVGEHSDPTAGETEFTIAVDDFEDYESSKDVTMVYEVRVSDTPYLQGQLILEPVTGTE
jgi:hypothetical protein